MNVVARIIALAILAVSGTVSAATWFAGEFLSVGIGPSAIAKGGAVTATATGTDAVYWNPAGLATTTRQAFAFEHAERFAGVITHDAVSAVFPVHTNALGITLFRGAIDGIVYADSSVLADPTAPLSQRNMPDPDKIHTFSNADYALYLAYGHLIAERINVGASAKLIYRTLAQEDAFGYGVDVGIHWKAHPNFTIGIVTRDISTTRVTWNNGRTDIVKPTIRVGGAYVWQFERLLSSVTASAETVYGSTSAGYAGFAPWRVMRENNPATLGVEYEWRDLLAVRVGTEDVRGLLGPGSNRLTAGVGVSAPVPWIQSISRIGFDLSWARHSLNDSFRLGTSIKL